MGVLICTGGGRGFMKTDRSNSLCDSLRRIKKREIEIEGGSAFRAAFMWVNTNAGGK